VRFEGADLREADLGGIDLSAAARLAGAAISKTQAAALLAELRITVI
jgi:fluoroquinolone resistance protein